MKTSLLQKLNNISIKKKLYFIAGVMLFLIALELFTLYSMVYLLSATRAFVGGEGLWSKAEKNALHSLLKYSTSHDEQDFKNYLSYIKVIEGDKKGRLALQQNPPDRKVAYQGLLEGRNQPEDIPRMMNLFIWFQNTYYLRAAGQNWIEADSIYIPKLLLVADQLHQEISNGTITPQKQAQLLTQLDHLNDKITVLADQFSYALGDASRWLENVVLKTVLALALIVELSGLLLTILVTFNIRKGIDEVTSVSKKVRNLDFSARAKRYSNDEMGQLASAFNEMIDNLQNSIHLQHEELEQRKKQQQYAFLRYDITRIMMQKFKMEDAIPKILKSICENLHLQYGGYWKIDNVDKSIHCIYVWTLDIPKIQSFAEKSKQLKFKYGTLLPGKAWETKEIVSIENLELNPQFTRVKLASDSGLKSGFAIPILYENEVHGIAEFFTNYFYHIDHTQMQMLKDICNLMGIFIQREYANARVASLSRLTGMAEVASNVLHNVGNTLNSLNTSVSLMAEMNARSKLSVMNDINKLFLEHKDTLGQFVTEDPRGKQIPHFFSLLVEEWKKEHHFFKDELHALGKYVMHIKNIIVMQQSLTQAIGVTEEIDVSELIEDAILLNKIAYERASVDIIRDFAKVGLIITNKDKLFQIIVNLIKNAIDSVMEIQGERKLIIRITEKDLNHIMIEFIDNGLGISPQNLTKIFSHGFTTKKTGHGYGLHTSAIYAEELGGDIYAKSKGLGEGATFLLILPHDIKSRRVVNT